MSLFCQAQPCSAEEDRLFGQGGHVQLLSDKNVTELMNYAVSIGLKRFWVQNDPVPHFNLTGALMARVMADPNVMKLERPEFVERYRRVERNMAGQ